MQADIVGFRADEAGIRQLLKRNDTARMLARRAIRVESSAKQYATGVGGGPNVRTGRLRASITWRVGEDNRSVYADVGSNVEYAVYVEMGTGRMAARPFLRPALSAARDE
jgi:HK97 gp10 family phage protein